MVEGGGFEPPKAEPSDLQSDPFNRSGTPPTISGALCGSGSSLSSDFAPVGVLVTSGTVASILMAYAYAGLRRLDKVVHLQHPPRKWSRFFAGQLRLGLREEGFNNATY